MLGNPYFWLVAGILSAISFIFIYVITKKDSLTQIVFTFFSIALFAISISLAITMPVAEVPYLVDGADSYKIESMYGDSVFIHRSVYNDNTVIVTAKSSYSSRWRSDFACADTSFGILYVKATTFLGLQDEIYAQRFLGADEFDKYFTSKIVRVREMPLR